MYYICTMSMPFTYGQVVVSKEFTNREKEQTRLINNYNASLNTIIISPRRWGKSSLVKHTARKAQRANKKLKVCFLDLYNIRTEEEFYQKLAQEVLKSFSGKWTELVENVKSFLKTVIPEIKYSPDNWQEFTLGLNWAEIKKSPDKILDLAESLCAAKKTKMVICIDEFQNIAHFEQHKAIQKKLRASWQHHQHVCYCLYGSKRHMMTEVFTKPNMPFYNFGELIFLEKIQEDDWRKFIVKRFRDTGKNIVPDLAIEIARTVECHPYYVQQLAQAVWLRTETEAKPATVESALADLISQMDMLFQTETDKLTNKQLNYLKAFLSGENQLSSKDTIRKYDLGTSSTVLRSKQALTDKEILDVAGNRTEMINPLYKQWLVTHFFKLK